MTILIIFIALLLLRVLCWIARLIWKLHSATITIAVKALITVVVIIVLLISMLE